MLNLNPRPMYSPYLFVLPLCFYCCFLGTESFAQSWNLSKDQSGVKVYTRKKAGWDLKEFKGVIYVNTDMKRVEATLRDASRHSDWMHKTHDTRTVKRVSDNLFYVYSRIATPWPVSDRDNVTKYRFKYISEEEFYIYFENVSGLVAEKSGLVRIKKMEGFWHVKKVGNNRVQVTQQAVAEAGGSIPAWLANSGVVDAPYGTLLALKQRLGG